MGIARFNNLSTSSAETGLRRCNASSAWVQEMLVRRPFQSREALFVCAKEVWLELTQANVLEAFNAHPKIGEIETLAEKYSDTASMAGTEQSGCDNADAGILQQLVAANERYLARFGFIFIVFATGKSAQQMLELLNGRMSNSPDNELQVAAAEQLKITLHRLEKML